MTTIEFRLEFRHVGFRHISHPTALGSLDFERPARLLAEVLLASRAGEFFGERQQSQGRGAVNVVERIVWQTGQAGRWGEVIGMGG